MEYDAPNQRFTEKSKARLYSIIAQHYQRFLNGQPTTTLDEPAEEVPPAPEAVPAANGSGGPLSAGADHPFEDVRDEFKKVGQDLFSHEWAEAEPWFITRWTTKNTPANVRSLTADLAKDEQEAILAALVEYAPDAKAAWQKSKTTPPPRPAGTRRPESARKPAPRQSKQPVINTRF